MANPAISYNADRTHLNSMSLHAVTSLIYFPSLMTAVNFRANTPKMNNSSRPQRCQRTLVRALKHIFLLVRHLQFLLHLNNEFATTTVSDEASSPSFRDVLLHIPTLDYGEVFADDYTASYFQNHCHRIYKYLHIRHPVATSADSVATDPC